MEGTVWTNERLDDFARRMDAGFERADRDLRELRQEVRELSGQTREGFESLHRLLIQVGGGLIAAMLVGFLSLLAAFLTTA